MTKTPDDQQPFTGYGPQVWLNPNDKDRIPWEELNVPAVPVARNLAEETEAAARLREASVPLYEARLRQAEERLRIAEQKEREKPKCAPVLMDDLPPPSLYGAPPEEPTFRQQELLFADMAIRAVLPRSKVKAIGMTALAQEADVSSALTLEVVRRLFFDGLVKSMNVQHMGGFRERVFWATEKCPVSARYVLPPHLRFSSSSGPPASHPSGRR